VTFACSRKRLTLSPSMMDFISDVIASACAESRAWQMNDRNNSGDAVRGGNLRFV
jgi:hypothetical protein